MDDKKKETEKKEEEEEEQRNTYAEGKFNPVPSASWHLYFIRCATQILSANIQRRMHVSVVQP